jgi:hypothetical protein
METTMPADRAGRPETGATRSLEDRRPVAAAAAESAVPREREYLREHIVLGYN